MEAEQKFVTEKVVAARLGLSTSWLRKDRMGAKSIPFVKLAKAVRYDLAAVDAAMRARTVRAEVQP